MCQNHLSNLALLTIERRLVKSPEKTPSCYDKVTDPKHPFFETIYPIQAHGGSGAFLRGYRHKTQNNPG